jgi:hypothetical protein
LHLACDQIGHRRRRALYRRIRHLSTIGDPEPGDEQAGEWSRDHLLRMDEKFRRRLERAIERGTETRQPEPHPR